MEALQAVAHQIKLIRKRMRKQQCKEEDMACLSARLSWQVVAVYVYSGNDLDVAAGFLQSKLPKNETHNMEDLRARVQRAYRSAPAAGVVALCHEAGVETHGAQPLVRACRYVVEARLYEWLLDQNCHRGVAPSRGQLVKFALSIVPEERFAVKFNGVPKSHYAALAVSSAGGCSLSGKIGVQSWGPSR